MNNHLLPFPYNQSRPPTWLDRIVQPLSHIFLSKEPRRSKPERPSATPFALPGNEQDAPAAAPPPIRIMCIADTHNTTPPLPPGPGDILIHAGDLTATGTHTELQSQLTWLSSQPHRYKIVIAGNPDILLDEGCDAKFPTRGGDSPAERTNLDWGGIRYLQDEAVTLEFPFTGEEQGEHVRKVTVYGSPHTPECGSFAFQYPAIRDVWTGRVPDDTDILVVHGPPALYGDCDGEVGQGGNVKVKGDGYLLREIRRVKPRLVVCGHIHGAYGLSVVRHDDVQDVVDGLQMGWDGYGFLGALKQAFWSKSTTTSRSVVSPDTLVVNAAIARSAERSEEKSAIAIDMY